jgi:hypothetical protein
VLVVLLAACGVAHGRKQSGKLSQWSGVEALPQGSLVEVGRSSWAGLDECRVESADDSALTCVAERPEGDARLVFARDVVRDLWVVEPAHDYHIWISVAIGFALGAILCGGGGPGPLFVCGAIGALIAADTTLGVDPPGMAGVGHPGPIRIARQLRLHRRLLYHMP